MQGSHPYDKLVQTKKETHRIERNNCRMRHWFGRFKHKSIIISKSMEMVNLTVALFTRFRVNGDGFDILKIGRWNLISLLNGKPSVLHKLQHQKTSVDSLLQRFSFLICGVMLFGAIKFIGTHRQTQHTALNRHSLCVYTSLLSLAFCTYS